MIGVGIISILDDAVNKKNLKKLFDTHVFYDTKNLKFECVLKAFGNNFKPTTFVSESTFPPNVVLFKGSPVIPDEIKAELDVINSLCQEVFSEIEKPYLLLRISNSSKLDNQLEDATNFFNTFFDDLIKLKNYPNVENISLEFISEDSSKKNLDNIPKDFFALTSKCGIGGITFGGADETK